MVRLRILNAFLPGPLGATIVEHSEGDPAYHSAPIA